METDRRGQVIVILAMLIVALLGFAALAIDVGYMYSVRHELQRSADAGALAGASAFIGGTWDNTNLGSPTMVLADTRARDLASRDTVVRSPLDRAAEVEVTFPHVDRIRVDTHRDVGMFFARIFGMSSRTISAYAVAEAQAADTMVDCIVPWGIPAPWTETSAPTDDEYYQFNPELGDVVHLPDETDCSQITYPMTVYDLASHAIVPPRSQLDWYPCTGALRVLKVGNPAGGMEPGHFLPVDFTSILTNCSDNVPSGSGANVYSYLIKHPCDCDTTLRVGDPITGINVEPGNMVGPTVQAVAPDPYWKPQNYIPNKPDWDSIMNMDPDSHWDSSVNLPVSPIHPYENDAWQHSPRIVRIPVYDPRNPPPSGNKPIPVIGFVGFWVEDINNDQGTVTGRYISVNAFGTGGGPPSLFGPTVKILRLVE